MKLDLDLNWLQQILSNGPLLIAGPCSAESESQLLEVAHNIKNLSGITYFRAGVWKPRTRPNCFEGIGAPALSWLQQVKKQTGLKVVIEVANANHTQLALEAGIDALWIGARTSANPFAVEEIARAVEGRDVPVLVKNPINPDLSLWLGAIERFQNRGIKKLMTIHRGFSTFSTQKYRNAPMWKIPMELKQLYPELPIICDPSHITGNRELIQSVSQKAYDVGFDGLMIETHPQPERALSDAAQQVTPNQLTEIISRLVYKSPGCIDSDVQERIAHFRDLIDEVDAHIIESLKQRQEIVLEIGKLKGEHQMTAFQVQRLDELLNMRKQLAKSLGINEHLINDIFHSIHEDSVKVQTNLMGNKIN